MQIANALYDSVFKFLLEDLEIAKLLLEELLQVKILDLEFKPQEYIKEVELSEKRETRRLKSYRVDFKARILDENQEQKVVLIEVQRARALSDIMRFRRYLGAQYALKDNSVANELGDFIPIPILTIYFLGFNLENLNSSIVRVRRVYQDFNTGKTLNTKNLFVEALTHDSIIIQTELLWRDDNDLTDLEKALRVFNPNARQIVEIDEKDYPVKFFKILKRLNMALQDSKIRELMEMEDELLLSYENKLKLIEKLQQQVEQEQSKVRLAIKEFFKSGKSISEIAAIFNMSEQEVWKIINS